MDNRGQFVGAPKVSMGLVSVLVLLLLGAEAGWWLPATIVMILTAAAFSTHVRRVETD